MINFFPRNQFLKKDGRNYFLVKLDIGYIARSFFFEIFTNPSIVCIFLQATLEITIMARDIQ